VSIQLNLLSHHPEIVVMVRSLKVLNYGYGIVRLELFDYSK
jgi:hypothetical protein